MPYKTHGLLSLTHVEKKPIVVEKEVPKKAVEKVVVETKVEKQKVVTPKEEVVSPPKKNQEFHLLTKKLEESLEALEQEKRKQFFPLYRFKVIRYDLVSCSIFHRLSRCHCSEEISC